MFLIRLILLPIKLALALLGISLKVGFRAGTLPLRATRGAGRVMGLRGVLFFVVGLAIGVLFAPGPGREVREKVRRLVAGAPEVSDSELAEKIGFELSHAPRTWHLPQPDVAVVQGRVELRGLVPHTTGREELERVASNVPGVAAVDNRLEVDGNGSGADAS